jgi:hypothetical protein
MSADRYTEEHHLTPKGWVTGTLIVYDKVKQTIERPKDTALTMLKESEQSCGFASEENSWREVWRSRDISTAQVKRLHKKFGDHPGQWK